MAKRTRPRHTRRQLLRAAAATSALAMLGNGCVKREPDDGKLHLAYWEKWARFEREAMEKVVSAFNESQNEIEVHYIPVGLADRKTLTATAGGDPPDLAGMWEGNVASFADRGVFTPLDAYIKQAGLTRDHWIPVYRNLCTHRDTMWAVPTTPATVALHWNKALFSQAGLDPDRPPATLTELDAYNEQLTRFDRRGNIIQMGFMPQEPGWFHWAWGPWFGAEVLDKSGNVTIDHPLHIAAFEWLQSFALKYGANRVNRFYSGFGNFASPQNAFFSGKVAMVVHGVWLHNYISQYAPGMQWGAAPWPRTPEGPEQFTAAQTDILTIPTGLPDHRREAAWAFLEFAISQPAMELLNKGQRKFPPLNNISETFFEDHPHKHIKLFVDMAHYDHIAHALPFGVWYQYQREITAAFEKMRVLEKNPSTGRPYTAAEALGIVQKRVSRAHERHEASLALRPSITGRPT